jgi:hypothetical protein
VSLPPRHNRKGDQQNHDSGGTDDVRHHGKQAGSVARVRPDKADDCHHDGLRGIGQRPITGRLNS